MHILPNGPVGGGLEIDKMHAAGTGGPQGQRSTVGLVAPVTSGVDDDRHIGSRVGASDQTASKWQRCSPGK